MLYQEYMKGCMCVLVIHVTLAVYQVLPSNLPENRQSIRGVLADVVGVVLGAISTLSG